MWIATGETLQLFKYLSPERADVLESLRIRFTQASALNDPFECFPGIVEKDREWYKAAFLKRIRREVSDLGIQTPAKRKQYIRQRKKEFENFYRCYSDDKWLLEQARSVVLMDSVIEGYLSLSATSTNVLMWSHYCQAHQGFVIGFDSDHEFFQYGTMKVQYSAERPFIDPTVSRQEPDVFYTKSRDWEYEQEYRKSMGFVDPIALENGNRLLPFPDEPPEPDEPALHEIRLFDFPKDCVSSVILGWKSKPELVERLRLALDQHAMNDIPLMQAKPHPHRFEMQILEP